MIKIAICDDQKEQIEKNKEMIEEYLFENQLHAEIHCFNNGDDLINACHKIKFSIIFLDIIMPLLNGIETAQEVRNKDKEVKIIFLTATAEFALASYSVKATDYCLKPIKYKKIKEILDTCLISFSNNIDNIILKSNHSYYNINIHEIEYIEAQNKQVTLYLLTNKCLTINESLYSFEQRLTNYVGFYRCHRSYIVYMTNIDSFDSKNIVTRCGRSVPIARGLFKGFKEAYFKFMFKHQSR